LKHNIKELKNILKKKDDELLEVKKMMKYTKIQELEVRIDFKRFRKNKKIVPCKSLSR